MTCNYVGNLCRVVEELDNMPLLQGSGLIKSMFERRDKKSKKIKIKSTDLSVKKLINFDEEELQEIHEKYDEIDVGNLPFEVKDNIIGEYNRIVNAALDTSFNDYFPEVFHKLSKNLHNTAYLGPLIKKKKKIVGNRYSKFFTNKKEPIYKTVNEANKETIKKINRFISGIPKKDYVELVFNTNPFNMGASQAVKSYSKKSRVISKKDLNNPNFRSMVIKVDSRKDGQYSFIVEDRGHIAAEGWREEWRKNSYGY